MSCNNCPLLPESHSAMASLAATAALEYENIYAQKKAERGIEWQELADKQPAYAPDSRQLNSNEAALLALEASLIRVYEIVDTAEYILQKNSGRDQTDKVVLLQDEMACTGTKTVNRYNPFKTTERRCASATRIARLQLLQAREFLS